MTVPRNILVIRLSSLGDVLLTIPAVKAIKLALPESKVSWLVEGAVAPLLAAQDFIDRVIEFPRGQLQKSMKSGHFVSAAGRFSLSSRACARKITISSSIFMVL
jgi:ADP-heptose:LPS heptosyltransferase